MRVPFYVLLLSLVCWTTSSAQLSTVDASYYERRNVSDVPPFSSRVLSFTREATGAPDVITLTLGSILIALAPTFFILFLVRIYPPAMDEDPIIKDKLVCPFLFC